MATRKTTGRVTPKKAVSEPGQVTSVEEWKSGTRGSPLRVPSGKTVIARNPGMHTFLEKGMIPNSLLNIVQEAVSKGKKASVKTMEVDEQKLKDMLELTDAICIDVIVEPKVHTNKNAEGEIIPYEERDDSKLYVDEIDVDDKMFIFQFAVGGTRDLERFRKESAQVMGDL